MTIRYLPEIQLYFRELSTLLYEKGYFGFKENAVLYVRELFDKIDTELPIKSRKKAPPYFNRYGKNMYYVKFKKNQSTQWYVFFTIHMQKKEVIYMIRYISNNHMISHYL